MNISEDIYQYFDGSLQSEQQTKLFAELSINEDKRLLFNNLFSIKKSIFENKSFFTPPVDSVSAIFSTIEYLKISDNKKTSKTTSYYLSNFFQSYKQGIICAVAAAIITAAILIPLFKYDSGKVRFPVQQASFRQTPVDNMEKVSNDMHPPEIHKKIVNPEKSSGSKFHSINEKEIIPEKIQESLKSYNIFPSLFSESYKNIQYFQNIRIENEKLSSLVTNNITHISDNSDKFSLELKGAVYWMLPEATISPKQYSKFNNSGLTLLYHISEEFSLGLNISQETFFQEFTGHEEDTIQYRYSQQPNFTSIGIVGRYYPAFLKFNDFKPLAEITIGGTNIGFTGKAAVGIIYNYDTYLSFLFECGLSGLVYQNENQVYSSNKIGFHYGISYNF